jgi:hypothetical protein
LDEHHDIIINKCLLDLIICLSKRKESFKVIIKTFFPVILDSIQSITAQCAIKKVGFQYDGMDARKGSLAELAAVRLKMNIV